MLSLHLPDKHATTHQGCTSDLHRPLTHQTPAFCLSTDVTTVHTISHLPSGSATSPTMTVMASCARNASLTCCMYSACVGALSLSAAMGMVRKVTTFTAVHVQGGGTKAAAGSCLCGLHVPRHCLQQPCALAWLPI